MSNPTRQLTQSHDMSAKVAAMLQTRMSLAPEPERQGLREDESMRIVIENLHRDVSEDDIRKNLSSFAPVGKIALVKEGSMPTAVIEMDMTRAQPILLATRIDGLIRKGQRLHAWVPLWRE